jgi:hypothetical protein
VSTDLLQSTRSTLSTPAKRITSRWPEATQVDTVVCRMTLQDLYVSAGDDSGFEETRKCNCLSQSLPNRSQKFMVIRRLLEEGRCSRS